MQPRNEHVILLHGLARTKRSMYALEKALQQEGYTVVNQGYPSTKHPIQRLAQNAFQQALAQCKGASRIHIITHSMGGILLRQYLQDQNIAQLGHVVMLGPPNQGCELVDKLRHFFLFRWINGQAGLQLGTDRTSIIHSLDAAHFSLGIIAGTRSINFLLSSLLPKPNDGKVSVKNTKLKGMAAHLSLPVTHTFMMNNPKVIQHSLLFLKEGRF